MGLSRTPKAARSALFLVFLLCDPRSDQLFHKGRRQRLVHGKAESALGGLEVLEFFLERLYHRATHREQTAMVFERGESHQRSLVLESRNTITDAFGGLRGHDGSNHRAN